MKVAALRHLAFLLVLGAASGLCEAPASAAGYVYDRGAQAASVAQPAATSAATSTTVTRNARIDAARTGLEPAGLLRASTSLVTPRRATKAAEILSKPVVDNPKLGNIVTDLYKGTTNPNRVGTGTTADAIRNEIATGQATAGRFHAQKGLEYERGLGNFLRRNPSASYRDRLTAQSLLDDLRSARGGP